MQPIQTADQLLAYVVATLQTLPVDQQQRFHAHLTRGAIANALPLVIEACRRVYEKKARIVVPNIDTDSIAQEYHQLVAGIMEVGRLKEKQRRDPPQRNQERDAAIVRLRDEGEMTFGEIPKELLRLNSKWGTSEGKKLSANAVKQAYRRAKQQSQS